MAGPLLELASSAFKRRPTQLNTSDIGSLMMSLAKVVFKIKDVYDSDVEEDIISTFEE